MITTLAECSTIEDAFVRRLAAASIIINEFKKHDLHAPILVGGTAVAIYSKGQYATVDLDFKSEQVEAYSELMKDLGFTRSGKDFVIKSLGLYVEFPSGAFEDNENLFREVMIEETGLPIYVTGVEDMILDRAMKYDCNGDQSSREWALRMMGTFYEEIDWSYLHSRAHYYNILHIINKIQRDYKRYRHEYDGEQQ